MAKTSPINTRRSARTTTTKNAPQPPTRGFARGAKKKTKNKLSSQSDDDDGIDPSLRKPPPETIATMPTLVAMPELPPPKKMRSGGGGDDKGVSGEDRDESPWDDDKGDDADYNPKKKSDLIYSSDDDDDDDNFKYDADLEEFELRDYTDPNRDSKFTNRRLRYDGGPQPRDYSKMTYSEKVIAEEEDKKIRRVWLQQERRNRMANEFGGGILREFSGIVTASLRTMQSVQEGTRLQVGQTFPSSKIVMLRCAEEANLQGIYLKTLRSDKFMFKTEGLNFYVCATNSESIGWKITTCQTSVGSAVATTITTHDDDGNDSYVRTPF